MNNKKKIDIYNDNKDKCNKNNYKNVNENDNNDNKNNNNIVHNTKFKMYKIRKKGSILY